jgi:formyltetrahydrofolate deformylase
MSQYCLNIACPDGPGIVAKVSKDLFEGGMNILESHQFGDPNSGRFFMRVAFSHSAADTDPSAALEIFLNDFETTAKAFSMDWQIYPMLDVPNVILMVSKFDHCLVDLIYRTRIGSLKMNIVAVVGNHESARKPVEDADIPFHFWSHNELSKAQVEDRLSQLVGDENVDLIILARYMQILSPEFTNTMPGRIINIHHSFLPSFKGAVPYSRAFERGVKMIGATAHFVTGDLDEGPIIAQGVADIRHDMSVSDLIDVGRDVERRTLAKAVKLYTQRRVLLNGIKTVVFE